MLIASIIIYFEGYNTRCVSMLGLPSTLHIKSTNSSWQLSPRAWTWNKKPTEKCQPVSIALNQSSKSFFSFRDSDQFFQCSTEFHIIQLPRIVRVECLQGWLVQTALGLVGSCRLLKILKDNKNELHVFVWSILCLLVCLFVCAWKIVNWANLIHHFQPAREYRLQKLLSSKLR